MGASRGTRGGTALFLGAGASKAFGYPLASEILPEIIRRLRKKKPLFSYGDKRKRKALKKCLQSFLPGHADRQAQASITDVVSLIEHSILNDRSPSAASQTEELFAWRGLLVEAMIELIHEADEVETTGDDLLSEFASWIDRRSRRIPGRIAIVSTNYDLSVEWELFAEEHPSAVATRWDFGFPWRDPGESPVLYGRPQNPRYRLFKLHGALYWLRCRRCEHVYVNPDGHIAHQAFRPTFDENNTCHCGQRPLQPVVIAPSSVRDVRDPVLLQVWSNALEFMRGADEWVIAGYSLPPEDIAIRSLLLRAYRARHEPPRVVVVQRQSANTEATRGRYRALFPRCEYLTNELSGWLASEGA